MLLDKRGRISMICMLILVLVFGTVLSFPPDNASAQGGDEYWNHVGGRSSISPYIVSSADLCLAPDGTPYVAFQEYRADTKTRVGVVKKYNGTAWEAVGGDGQGTNGIFFNRSSAINSFQITTDRNGKPVVAYLDPLTQELILKKLQDDAWVTFYSSEFSEEYRIYGYGLAYDTQNKLHIAYSIVTKEDNKKFEVKMAVINDGVWQDVGGKIYEFTNPSNNDYSVSFSLSASDVPYVAFKLADQAKADHVAVMRYANDLGWVVAGTEDASLVAVNDFTLKVSGETPYLAYNNQTLNTFLPAVKVLGDAGWVPLGGEEYVYNDKASNIVFDVDANGTPYIAFNKTYENSKMTILRWDGTEWKNVGNILDVPANSPALRDLRVNTEGHPYLFYIETVNGSNSLQLLRYKPTEVRTVRYTAGLHGAFADSVEQVALEQFPAAIPEPVAQQGYGFVGWSGSDQPELLLSTSQVREKAVGQDITYTAIFKLQASGLTVGASSVGGSGHYWETELSVVPGPEDGHRLLYRNYGSLTPSIPIYGEEVPLFISLPSSGIIYAADGDLIGVVEVDADGKAVRFGTVNALAVERVPDAPVLNPVPVENGKAELTWSPVEGAIGYKIYQTNRTGTGSVAGYAELAALDNTMTSHTIANLANGTTYYYRLASVYPNGVSALSNEVAVNPATAPGVPDIIAATSENGYVMVMFNEPQNQGGRTVIRYEAADETGKVWATGLESPIIIRDLEDKVEYRFQVRAVNAVGAGSYSQLSQAASANYAGSEGIAGYFQGMDLPDATRQTGGYVSGWLGKGIVDNQDNVIVVEDVTAATESQELLYEGTVKDSAFVSKINTGGQREWLMGLYTSGNNKYDGPTIWDTAPTEQQKEPYFLLNAAVDFSNVAQMDQAKLVAGGTIGVSQYLIMGQTVGKDTQTIRFAPESSKIISYLLKELRSSRDESTAIWTPAYHLSAVDPAISDASNYGSPSDAIFAITGANGKVSRVLTLGGYGEEKVKAITSTSDGGFIAIGSTTSTDGDFAGLPVWSGSNFFIVKYDRDGERQWLKKLGSDNTTGNIYMDLASIRELPEGGYVLAGTVNQGKIGTDAAHQATIQYSPPFQNSKLCGAAVIKLDSNGDLGWVNYYFDGKISMFYDTALSADGSQIVAVGDIGWSADEQAGYGGGTMSVDMRGAFAHTFRASTGEALVMKSYSKAADKLLSTETEARPNRLLYAEALPEGGFLLAGQASALSGAAQNSLLTPNGDVKGKMDIIVMKTTDHLQVEWLSFVGSKVDDFYKLNSNDADRWGIFAKTRNGFAVGFNREESSNNRYERLGGYITSYSYDWDHDGIINSRDFYPDDPDRSIPEGKFAGWLNLDREPSVTAATYLTWKQIAAYPPSGSVYEDVNGNINYQIPNVAIADGSMVLTAPVPVLDRVFRGEAQNKTLAVTAAETPSADLAAIAALLDNQGFRMVDSVSLGAAIGDQPIPAWDAKVKVRQTVTGITYSDMTQLFYYDGSTLELVDAEATDDGVLTYELVRMGTYVVGEGDDPNLLASREVRERIAALPAVGGITLEMKPLVADIRSAYESLVRKELVTNLYHLQAVEVRLVQLQNMSDSEAALAVAELLDGLNAIMPIQLKHEPQIVEARASYDLLTDQQKVFIPAASLQALEKAEAQLSVLQAEAVKNSEAANAVMALINQLPATLKLENESDVMVARTAYQQLTAQQKALVLPESLARLATAESLLERLKAEADETAAATAVTAAIDTLPAEILLTHEAAVAAVRNAYAGLSQTAKALVPQTSLDKLAAAEQKIKKLKEQSGGYVGVASTPSNANKDAQDELVLKAEEVGRLVADKLDSRTISTFILDPSKLSEKLAGVEAGAVKHLVLSVSGEEAADTVAVRLDASLADILSRYPAVLDIGREGARYLLPISELLAFFRQLPAGAEDAVLQVEIGKAEPGLEEKLRTAASADQLSVIAPMVDFKVFVETSGQKRELHRFAGYVERRIPISDPNPAGKAAGISVNEDGTYRPVPTRVEKDADGVGYAVLSSRSNSVYTVVSGAASFTDIKNHWSQPAVEDLAGRLILKGFDNSEYKPDGKVTRAEFAAMITRGLGLGAQEADEAPFADLVADAWYGEAVEAAYAYRLISGFEDGTFRPDAEITREEAMAMLANAIQLTELADQVKAVPVSFDSFTDAAGLSRWAEDAARQCLALGIVTGRTETELAPQAGISRAEVAVMLQRLLEKSKLI